MEFRKGIKKMEFKVGDRVKYTGTMTRNLNGKVGVVKVVQHPDNIVVNFEGEKKVYGCLSSSLTKIEDKPANKFKVGDIIKGTKLGNSEYTITNEKMTKAKVMEIRSDDLISIQVIEFALKGWEGDFFTVNPNFFELVNDKTIIKHKWTYGELIKAQELSKQLLYKIYFEQNMSVVFYINNQDVQATLKFGLPSRSISVIAKPTKYDKFSVVIGKCVCLCKLTGTKIPDFISGSND